MSQPAFKLLDGRAGHDRDDELVSSNDPARSRITSLSVCGLTVSSTTSAPCAASRLSRPSHTRIWRSARVAAPRTVAAAELTNFDLLAAQQRRHDRLGHHPATDKRDLPVPQDISRFALRDVLHQDLLRPSSCHTAASNRFRSNHGDVALGHEKGAVRRPSTPESHSDDIAQSETPQGAGQSRNRVGQLLGGEVQRGDGV